MKNLNLSRFYKSEDGKTLEEERRISEGTIHQYLVEVDAFMMGTKRPDGGHQFPAKDCKDLKLCHPDVETGKIPLCSFGLKRGQILVI